MRAIIAALFMLSFIGAALAQTVAIDVNSTGNTATSLGTTDSCISATAGSTVNIDVVISGATDVFALSTRVNYPSSILRINSKNANLFLGSTIDLSDGLPDSDGTYLFFAADNNGAGHNGAGTVVRFNLTVLANGNGYINLNETSLINSNNEYIGDTNGDTYYDGTVTNGQILVGQSCDGATTTTTSVTTTSTTVAGATTSTTLATTTTTLPVTNLSVFSHNFTNIVPGTTSFVTVTNANIQIKEISIQVKNTVNNVSLTISKLSGKPASVTAPSAKAYQYFQIDHTNMNNSDISMAFIKFTVAKSWLADNSVPASTVALQRYNAGSWNKLVITQTAETSSEIEYRAESPGLSAFVITGDAPVTTTTTTTAAQPGEVPQTTTTAAPSQNQEGGGSADAGVTTTSTLPPKGAPKPMDLIIFFVLIVVIVIVVAILYLRHTGRTSASAAITPPESS